MSRITSSTVVWRTFSSFPTIDMKCPIRESADQEHSPLLIWLRYTTTACATQAAHPPMDRALGRQGKLNPLPTQ